MIETLKDGVIGKAGLVQALAQDLLRFLLAHLHEAVPQHPRRRLAAP